MIRPLFRDRQDAGRQLANALHKYAELPNLLILGLPRGGVPVAYEVAHALNAPLDIFMVRKLGVPGHQELAMGALATGDVIVWNREIVDAVKPSQAEVDEVIERERRELARRDVMYRGNRPHPEVRDRVVMLIDDGLATGASMRAAAEALRLQKPDTLVVAVPVAPAETCQLLRESCDDVVCATTPEPFTAVGLWYYDFEPTSDQEVRELLERARTETTEGAAR